MNAAALQEDIEEVLMRNLSILVADAMRRQSSSEGGAEPMLKTDEVRATLRSCAANLAQAYADRVHREDCGALVDDASTGPRRCRCLERDAEENGPSDEQQERWNCL